MNRNLLVPESELIAPRRERRRTIRQKLHSPVFVSFNGPQSGMVVDLSELLDLHEHGFAVQTAIPAGIHGTDRLEVNHAVSLCLELPETKKYVHGSGQVMWTDNTGRAGIRFSFLPDNSRQVLKEWLFANLLVASTNHAARLQQIAHRQQDDSSPADFSAREASTPEPVVPQLRSQDISVHQKPTVLSQIPILKFRSDEAGSALADRAELLSALDDVRYEVRELESQSSTGCGAASSSGLNAILQLITERAMTLTGASGAALALRDGEKTLCRAHAGQPAPPVGSEVNVKEGLSGECVRNGILVTCRDPETDPRVDPDVCRALGIGSFVAAPIFADTRVVGLLEIFSPTPRTFTSRHGTMLQRLAELVPPIKEKKVEDTETGAAQNKAEEFEPAQVESARVQPAHAEPEKIEAFASDAAFSGDDTTSAQLMPVEPSHEASNELLTELPNAEQPNTDLPKADLAKNALPNTDLRINELPNEDFPMHPAASEDFSFQQLQFPDEKPAPATPRLAYSPQLLLLLMVLGTVALVLGYVLAPTIQKRWSGPSHASANSVQSSDTAPQSALSSTLPATSGHIAPTRSHTLSPQELRRLADQGDPDAQYQLGILYHDGSTVPRSDAQAVQWFQRAAEQGYVRAQSTLGAYYWAGRGVPQDYSKAYFWSQLALAQGDQNSKSRLEGLSAQMTRAQVAEARQQAEAWLHAHTHAKPSPGSK